MDYMTIKEASEKWGLSIRRMQEICASGRVPGVVKFGREWAIPKDAQKPDDARIKSGKYIKS
ncbi:MAG: helix-turn-helix domain-containing protein [Lachnospiraceae bacterium]|nr:helix-turn-helix domain-containing protein [Lachnospiraceae bacterium]